MKPLPPKQTTKRTRTRCPHGVWVSQCRPCKNKAQRERRRLLQNGEVRRYEKTPKGFLMRAHRNIRSRVEGVQRKKAHLYQGLPACDRHAFYAWSLDNPNFWRLFRQWEAAGYPVRLAPSVNRINPDKGYLLDNIEWVTHSVNSALARPQARKVVSRLYARYGA